MHSERRIRTESTPRLPNEFDVEIEGVHTTGTETSHDDLGADAAPAPDLEDTHAFDPTSESLEQRSFVMPLQGTSHRVVHQGLLDPIELHDNWTHLL
jgi:hypothetical protein